jgi:hypothetical protein
MLSYRGGTLSIMATLWQWASGVNLLAGTANASSPVAPNPRIEPGPLRRPRSHGLADRTRPRTPFAARMHAASSIALLRSLSVAGMIVPDPAAVLALG